MDEPVLATFHHPILGQLDLVLSTCTYGCGGKERRAPYLWVGRHADGEVLFSVTTNVKGHRTLPPNHTWVRSRASFGLRALLLATGVVKDTGVRSSHEPPAELWEYQLPPPPPIPATPLEK